MSTRAYRHCHAALGALAVTIFGAHPAAADDTIKHPGDHPKYVVEIEPHGVFDWWTHWGYVAGAGFGLGARFSIPIVDNGFIPSINNSVAISFGVDWVHYAGNSCFYYGPHPGQGCYSVGDANFLVFPVVMQWNFFVARSWSVFGEPGLAIWHGWFDWCGGAPMCNNPSTTGLEPAFFVGGRYHFNEHVALTMRLGYPMFTVGVSFM
jgi:hypothetical protein